MQKQNCCHFSAALCTALGLTLPPWVLQLSSPEVLARPLPAEKKGRGSAIISAAQAHLLEAHFCGVWQAMC